jgi:hypothetical protein
MSKGSTRRLCLVPRTEYELRHDLAFGKISLVDFTRRMEKLRRGRKRVPRTHI